MMLIYRYCHGGMSVPDNSASWATARQIFGPFVTLVKRHKNI